MGDAGIKTENYLLEEYSLPKMDILKVGHHGSRYSTSELFLKIINPKKALISVGVNNKFKHPHKELIDRLENNNIPYLKTSISGMIKINLSKNTIYTCN